MFGSIGPVPALARLMRTADPSVLSAVIATAGGAVSTSGRPTRCNSTWCVEGSCCRDAAFANGPADPLPLAGEADGAAPVVGSPRGRSSSSRALPTAPLRAARREQGRPPDAARRAPARLAASRSRCSAGAWCGAMPCVRDSSLLPAVVPSPGPRQMR
jgi:hypothetical protein